MCSIVMYGSDWTVSELSHSYPEWVTLLDEVLVGTGASEQQRIWRDNARRIYRLGDPASGARASIPNGVDEAPAIPRRSAWRLA